MQGEVVMALENDIVLIYFENQPLVFARIEEILPDVKPYWYHVKLLMLQVPLQEVTWILRDVYINGDEFTMDGKKMRLELVERAKRSRAKKAEKLPEKNTQKSKNGNVISLAQLKKR
jgi:hypothetical protein